MKDTNATFGKDDVPIMPVPCILPSHIVKVEKGINKGSIVYNITTKVAEEANGFKIPYYTRGQDGSVNPIMDGNEQREGPPINMIGKEYRSNGIWLDPNPAPNKKWRNNNYSQFAEALQAHKDGKHLQFPLIDIGGVKVKALKEFEEDDIIGMPVLVKYTEESFTGRDDKQVVTLKGTSFFTWASGKRIEVVSEEEEAPF